MSNFGLSLIPAPESEFDLQSYQGLYQVDGLNNIGKGWNEFLLYGDDFTVDLVELTGEFYYFYTAMTWNDDDLNRPIA